MKLVYASVCTVEVTISFDKTMVDDTTSLTEFWKHYNIRHAMENTMLGSKYMQTTCVECGNAFCVIVQIAVISKKKLVEEITGIVREL
jgi:hypothetical protein